MWSKISLVEFARRGTTEEGHEPPNVLCKTAPKIFLYKFMEQKKLDQKKKNAKAKAAFHQHMKDLERVKNYRQSEWYGIRSLLGYTWAIFLILLGARESGKSYAVMEQFIRDWKYKGRPFTWLRLNEASTKKMLANKADKFVDPDIARRYELDLTVRKDTVYDHGKKMATVLALSTYYNDKGVSLFDKDYDLGYNICLDEFEMEKDQKRQGDIGYQFVNQLENLVRSTKKNMRIFLIGNTLEEVADILTLFNFIPEEFGRFKLKKKRAVIDYLPPTQQYIERRKGSVADILAGDQSNFTNKIDFDKTLIYKGRLHKPSYIIAFSKKNKFTVWDSHVVAEWNGENLQTVIAMRPYIDLVFNAKQRDAIINIFDTRAFCYKNLITNKKFQKEISLIKPRKN